jgi:hypothetical protein
MWKIIVQTEQAPDDSTIRRMRFACWIPKATETHSEYFMLIAFLRQQWLCESALMVCYAYIALPVWFV